MCRIWRWLGRRRSRGRSRTRTLPLGLGRNPCVFENAACVRCGVSVMRCMLAWWCSETEEGGNGNKLKGVWGGGTRRSLLNGPASQDRTALSDRPSGRSLQEESSPRALCLLSPLRAVWNWGCASPPGSWMRACGVRGCVVRVVCLLRAGGFCLAADWTDARVRPMMTMTMMRR